MLCIIYRQHLLARLHWYSIIQLELMCPVCRASSAMNASTPGSNELFHFIPHAPVCRSVVEVCRYMNHYSGPKFLMGDFNSTPYSKEMAFLQGEVPFEGTSCRHLTDVCRESPQYRNMAIKPSDRAGLTFSAIEDNPTN